jgi:hypothetical protein
VLRFERRCANELLVLVDGGCLRHGSVGRAVRTVLDVPLHHVASVEVISSASFR